MNKLENRPNTTGSDEKQQMQYVTFLIGNEHYGVEVLKVQEITGITQITHVPNSMGFMKGVINLRGSVVPVIDMRKKFNMEEKEYDNLTVILVVEVRERLIGMIVDSVSDVVSVPIEDVHDTPHFSSSIETDFISGIGNVNDQLLIMLDIDKILSTDEIEQMSSEK